MSGKDSPSNLPDSWEQDAEAGKAELTNQFTRLNVNAASFVPGQNVHAPTFVPSWGVPKPEDTGGKC